MRSISKMLALVGALLLVVLSATTTASATPATPGPSTTYVTVAWAMPSQTIGNNTTWNQTLVASYTHSHATFDLPSFTPVCGTDYQLDIYKQHKLPDGGLPSVLHPGDDTNWLIPGSWGVAYKIVHTDTYCPVTVEVPPAPVATPPTCQSPGALVVPENSGPYKWTTGPGANQVQVHLIYGYQFADGTRGPVTFTEDVLPQLTGAQCAGDQPPNDVEHQDVTDAPNCDALTVTTEHQSRTREYVLDGDKWVPGPWSAWTTDSTTVTDATYGGACKFFIETSSTISCGTASITLHNHSTWIYPVSYSLDGSTPDVNGPHYGPVVDNRGSAPNDQSATKTFTFDEDSGVHTIKYVVAAGTESDLYKGLPVGEVTTLTVNSNCQPDLVTPGTPSVKAGVCDTTTGIVSAPVVTVPETDHISYDVSGLIVTARIVDEGYTFGSQLPDGWTLQEDGSAQYVLTVTQPDCNKQVVTPPAPPTKTVTVTPPAKTVTKHNLVKPVSQPTPEKNLASTGFDSQLWGGIAVLVLVLGGLITFAGRRNRSH